MANAIPAAATRATDMFAARVRVSRPTIPISMIEMPMVFRMSTRSKSVQGAQGMPSTYSCTRNSRPSPRISAPRRIALRAIWFAPIPFSRILPDTRAIETPARKRKSGAGIVPLSCDHFMNCESRALPPSHES